MRKLKKQIIYLMIENNYDKETAIGAASFLHTEEQARQMLEWLKKNIKNKPTQQQIGHQQNIITGIIKN